MMFHRARMAAPTCTAPRGFTLVEVLVALVVMAIMAVMAWQGVDGIVRTRDVSQARLEGFCATAFSKFSTALSNCFCSTAIRPR